MSRRPFVTVFLTLIIASTVFAAGLDRARPFEVPVYFEQNVGQVDLQVASSHIRPLPASS